MLSRLTDGDVSQAVRVVAIEAPLPVVMAGTLRPRVRLRGATTSTAASLVAYEIAQGTRIVHRGQVEIGALTASQDSVLEIPVVGDLPAGAYILRAGVLQGDRPTGVQEIRFHIVQPREPFEAVALPGPLVGGNGAGFLDVDDDGRLDLYLTRLGDANLFFHNTADGFAERADEIGLDDRQRGRSFAAADIDADGDLDVYLVNEAANALMRNDGGAFAPVAADEALRDPSPGRGAAFFDADDDGLLDLYVINAWAPNRLFVRGAEGWREASAELGLDDGANARGLALADTDADGDVDLFLANNDGSSRLLADRGESFVDVTTATGLAGVAGDVACAFADYDGDGHTDLLVANQGGPTRLYRGRISGFAPVDSVDLGGRNVGVAFFDFDNDGDLDLATTALDPVFGGDELYENLDGELLPVGGLMSLSRSAAGRGISVGDYDDDGDQDLFVADNLASRLYTNRSRMARALRVELVGPPDNREGIGARVRVALGERILVRDMQPSYGYGSYRPAVLHFGLGTLAFTNVHVLWPDGARSLVDSAVESVPESGRLVVHHPEVPTVVDLVVDPRPATFYLDAAFPNPFNARVVLPFGVDASTRVRLQVYGVGGQRIRTLVDEDLATGGYRATWDGRDGDGRPVASGVYLVRLQSTTRQATVRVLLLK
jgi:hypothetical protein